MTLEILTMEQGSPEWHAAKVGIPSASNFSAILANGRGGAPSKTRLTYLRKLAGERMNGKPAESYQNAAMQRGNEIEAEIRDWYGFSQGVDVRQVGFIKNGGVGYSPDGLVGDDGLFEAKSMEAHILIGHREADRPPPEHIPQIQGGMWVSGRDWLDLVCYCSTEPAPGFPGIDPLVFRIHRDDTYISETLAPAVQAFNRDLEGLVDRLNSGGRLTGSKNLPPAAPPAPAVDLSTADPVF